MSDKFILQGDTLEEKIYQAIGAASTCWEKLDKAGVFQDELARKIGDALLEEVRKYVTPDNAWPSLDSQMESVYSGAGWCEEGGWVDVIFDQWWVLIVHCEHGSWKSNSNGITDPGLGLQRALALAKKGHGNG